MALSATGMLASCASLSDTGNPSFTRVSHSTSAVAAKLSKFALAGLLPGPPVGVITVRAKDLKSLPTGHERAIAYASERKQGFGFFGGPVDFKEPTLPEPGSELDGSLLPPRIP